MTKLLTILLVIFGTFTLSTAAEKYDTKAFRTITKLCTPCHGTPFYMAKQVDDDDWKFYFNTEGKLISMHKGEPKRLLKFLVNNSKYSGKVNGCDANFCGTNH